MKNDDLRPRRRIQAGLAPVALSLAAALTAPVPSLAADASFEETDTLEESFTLPARPGAVVRVCNVEGDVTARGHDGRELRLVVHETFRGKTRADLDRAKEKLAVRIDREGDAVDLSVGRPCGCDRDCRNDREHDDWDRFGAHHDFELQVPRRVRVELGTVTGDMTLREHRGDFRLSNVNGSVHALDVAGSGSVTTVNGGLEVRFAENPREATSFRTVNGRVDVTFQPGLAAELAFKTLNGEVYTDLPLKDGAVARASRDPDRGRHTLRRRWRTAAAGGDAIELSFATVNGDIYLRGGAR
ncbi:MAG: hypothetical protein ACOC7L_03455 [Acidobacteriota bacterium]